MPRRGRKEGSVNLSVEERTEIAIAARGGENQTVIAERHGVTQAEVSYIEKGKIQGTDEEAVESELETVRRRAVGRLLASLGLLTDDKISGASAKEISVIAANMGRVVQNTMPQQNNQAGINLIVYAPTLRAESGFKVHEVG
jgi:predicted transcriptional regulator